MLQAFVVANRRWKAHCHFFPECVKTKLCKPCTSFTSHPHSSCGMVWYRTYKRSMCCMWFAHDCARGHWSVRVGDSSWRSEDIVKKSQTAPLNAIITINITIIISFLKHNKLCLDKKEVACLLACLTSQQYASVSQGQICSDNCVCAATLR